MPKMVTGKCLASYANILKPRAATPGGDEKYSVTLGMPKTDAESYNKLLACVEAAKQEGVATKWGGAMPKGQIPMTIYDGDREDANPEMAGCWEIRCSSVRKPGCIDLAGNEILDPMEVYSGCYVRAAINVYPYNFNGKKGISVGLNHIQKVADGEPLGGTGETALEAFGLADGPAAAPWADGTTAAAPAAPDANPFA